MHSFIKPFNNSWIHVPCWHQGQHWSNPYIHLIILCDIDMINTWSQIHSSRHKMILGELRPWHWYFEGERQIFRKWNYFLEDQILMTSCHVMCLLRWLSSWRAAPGHMELYPSRFQEDSVEILSIEKIVIDSGLQLPSPTALQYLILCKTLQHGNIPATVITMCSAQMPYAHYQGVITPEIYL